MADALGLEGCRVIVTRPEDQAEALARPLRQRGAEVRVRPLVRIGEPADGGRRLAEALARLERYQWIVFTSSNAVRACVASGGSARRWPRVGCVGDATARVAREHGLVVSAIPATFSGEALAQAMREAADLRGARVLWPRASGAGAALQRGLEEAGAEVDAIEAYRTVEDAPAGRSLRDELERAPADLVTFTSPSGVRVFTLGAERYSGAVAVIGTVTGRVARAAGLEVAVQPETHTMEALTAAIEHWYRRRGGS